MQPKRSLQLAEGPVCSRPLIIGQNSRSSVLCAKKAEWAGTNPTNALPELKRNIALKKYIAKTILEKPVKRQTACRLEGGHSIAAPKDGRMERVSRARRRKGSENIFR